MKGWMNERRDKGNSRQRYFTSQEFLNLYMYGVEVVWVTYGTSICTNTQYNGKCSEQNLLIFKTVYHSVFAEGGNLQLKRAVKLTS